MTIDKIDTFLVRAFGFLWFCSLPIFTAYAMVRFLTD